MSTSSQTLIQILRAAHCRSTHHHFALDATELVQTDSGKRLVSQLLRHHGRYLTGAKDPDTRFRDFQNHVIHVDDGYWGGAPRVAHQWYDRLQRYLHQSRYSDAAHAAGVLSHYFTDPIQPLHTAQTPLEKVLHRPIEWCITQNYANLLAEWKSNPTRIVFQLSDQSGWLGEAILQSARLAHGHYQTLLDHFDLAACEKNSRQGLTTVSRRIVSQLIGLSVTGWARILERAAEEAERRNQQTIPVAGLTLPMVLSGIRVPDRLWVRRITHKVEREKVENLIAEFRRTGDVTQNLASEVRVLQRVREIHEREKNYRQRKAELAAAHKALVQAEEDRQQRETVEANVLPFIQTHDNIRLHLPDPLVDAPSIGKKTAARFAGIGIHTVGEFLQADVPTMARRLDTRWITEDTLQAWRCQALLMCQLPSMLAREVQLLVGAGYATTDALAKSNSDSLYQAVTQFAETYSGRRYLRGAETPTRDRLDIIIGDAAHAMIKVKRGQASEEQASDTAPTISTIQSSDAAAARRRAA
ncbi:DUF4332 domain-containing protein [Rhodopirellula halodulae]|uniref:DUF4332 domain-containing protein n=1 Tax=Rhodopirellula halodulae TaxID=2894198 RepID=UPI001E5AFF26|nr:DUF4332 domain-containing protein [Rhodopirellula sp. JC737]MCC9657153.1 DUF4332 domain-containing protein [Rhodopirellula sp. JC737]